MKLYGFFRSSAAYRVRIALGLKSIAVDHAFVHLRRKDQQAPGYVEINPQALVPTLITDSGQPLTQSLAIMEYLDEIQPSPALLPKSPEDRAWVRSLALAVACDIHPLNNTRVLGYLKEGMGLDQAAADRWYAHWIAVGLQGLEAMLAKDSRVGPYCCGDQVTLADICLVPQLFNAERMNCPTEAYPTIRRIAAALRALPAFQAAEPGRQPDAE
ncbi:maleylacetoacetate isomerase [Paramagnetospirillum kuznetsovii]|uniref:Maleylacetoacetate isomerase n=1 Tax=Paramagnetospirillum kuznetsovii TaxID=2053833 RepID=A0A364NWT4_9PROT|nr:maleylacetoacetate isomerase [Paramagnetospirillum kuznetsovii]RAU21440.1 maleylacetoacetate isomerase [Paramagnetospirillum kuznetsovii]